MRIRRSLGVSIFLSLTIILLPRLLLLIVVVVPLEQLLHPFIPQQQLILLRVLLHTRLRNLFFVIFAFDYVGRDERRADHLFEQLDPGELVEPRMLFYLIHSIKTAQSLRRLSLNHLT